MKSMIATWMKGIGMGAAIAAPLGPIGTMVLRRALNRGWLAGVCCGAGVACADLCYAMAAAEGIRVAAAWAQGIAMLGALGMLWMAAGIWRSRGNAGGDAAPGQAGGFWMAFVLTIANPMTIVSFAALIAGAGNQAPLGFALGIGCGSLLWWGVLSAIAVSLGPIVRSKMHWVNAAAACMIGGCAAWMLATQCIAWLAPRR